MRVRLILAHPLQDSLNRHLAMQVQGRLEALGHDVALQDLYAEGFGPALTASERRAYYTAPFADETGLGGLDGLVLVFPTWWFGLPAMLKGWIDRSFLPGVAYDHDKARGALTPRLHQLRQVMAVTTLGAPGVYDHLIVRRPVFHALKYGLVKACAPKARFRMLSLYRAETVTPQRLKGFETPPHPPDHPDVPKGTEFMSKSLKRVRRALEDAGLAPEIREVGQARHRSGRRRRHRLRARPDRQIHHLSGRGQCGGSAVPHRRGQCGLCPEGQRAGGRTAGQGRRHAHSRTDRVCHWLRGAGRTPEPDPRLARSAAFGV